MIRTINTDQSESSLLRTDIMYQSGHRLEFDPDTKKWYLHMVLSKKIGAGFHFDVTERVHKLKQDMEDTIKYHDAIGLASNQIGEIIPAIMVKTSFGYEFFLKPYYRTTRKPVISRKEGCLSIPNVYNDVKRFKRVKLGWSDINGNEPIRLFRDQEAFCVQHEIDHLSGILMTDETK